MNDVTDIRVPEELVADESIPLITVLERLQQYGYQVKATFDLKTSRHKVKVKKGSFSYEFSYSRLDSNSDHLFRLGLETAVDILEEKYRKKE